MTTSELSHSSKGNHPKSKSKEPRSSPHRAFSPQYQIPQREGRKHLCVLYTQTKSFHLISFYFCPSRAPLAPPSRAPLSRTSRAPLAPLSLFPPSRAPLAPPLALSDLERIFCGGTREIPPRPLGPMGRDTSSATPPLSTYGGLVGMPLVSSSLCGLRPHWDLWM